MTKNQRKDLIFLKKDRTRFLVESESLSTRAKNILTDGDMLSWDSFYYHLFINHDIKDFKSFRNSGVNTEKELIRLMRKILNHDGRYNQEIERFDYEFSLLNTHSRNVLKNIGISLFETFYYRLVIEKEIIDLSRYHPSSGLTRSESEKFIESFCSYLGVKVPKKIPVTYFDPNYPSIPFIPDRSMKKIFSSEINSLSNITRTQLAKIQATSIQGFYSTFISPDSEFCFLLKEFGESNLLEILRLRTLMQENIKDLQKR
jgi:hypothetical protein